MGKTVEICTRLGVRSGDDGKPMGRRDARAWHDEVPEAHLWVFYSQRKLAEIYYYFVIIILIIILNTVKKP